jgi:hypothetical protein
MRKTVTLKKIEVQRSEVWCNDHQYRQTATGLSRSRCQPRQHVCVIPDTEAHGPHCRAMFERAPSARLLPPVLLDGWHRPRGYVRSLISQDLRHSYVKLLVAHTERNKHTPGECDGTWLAGPLSVRSIQLAVAMRDGPFYWSAERSALRRCRHQHWRVVERDGVSVTVST